MKTKGEFKLRNIGNSSSKIDAKFSTKHHTSYNNVALKKAFFDSRRNKTYLFGP